MNFSTTSSDSSMSCSNSIADSEMTSSAAYMGAPERTARAIASLGRESISSSRPATLSVIEAKKVFSRSSVTETSLLPQAADAAGIGFDELVSRVLESARTRSE